MKHIGLVGCGKIGRRHLVAYRLNGGCRITAFDPIPELLEQMCREFGIHRAASLEALLGDDSIEAIDICTPTEFHKDIAIRAMQSGKHVFCEKPLCAAVEEAVEIELVRREYDRMVMVGYLFRFAPVFRFIKEALNAGALGRPIHALMRIGGRGSYAEWKHTRARQGGARLEKLVHILDLVGWYFGEIQEVEVIRQAILLNERFINGRVKQADAEDFMAVTARTSQVEALCQADLASARYMNYIDLQGENGAIFASLGMGLPLMISCDRPIGDFAAGTNYVNFPESNFFVDELAFFLKLLNGSVAGGYHSVSDSIAMLRALAGTAGRLSDDHDQVESIA